MASPRNALVCALLVESSLIAIGYGQDAPAPAEVVSGTTELAAGAAERGPQRLPSWVRLGTELTGRLEVGLDNPQKMDDRFALTRIRVSASLQPVRWLELYLEGQDARGLRLSSLAGTDGQRNGFDVRRATLRLGNSEQGFQASFGRQEIAVSDERLVGADHFWDLFGQTFDAVRVAYSTERARVQAFAGYRVTPAARRPDRFDRGSRIVGLSFERKGLLGQSTIEPYLLWKRGANTHDLADRAGHRDVATPGLRAQGELPRSLDYNLEVAFQAGHVVGDQVAAWAGHWELGWKPLGRELGPRISLEYNHASGDDDPDDGRHTTFDDLYPAGFNAYGITDPFAWRNIRYPAAGVTIPINRRWTVYGGYRSYWLANVQDGLYPGGDEYAIRNAGATSGHVGSQVYASISTSYSRWWRIYAGYGHFFAGGYLNESGCPSALRTIYLLTSVRF